MFILDFKTATGRLLTKVEIEEEIARFQFRFRRPTMDREEKGSGFERKPSFGIPIPYDQRPVSADGKISFYFDHSTITKRRLPGKSSGKVGSDGREPVSNFASDAQDHDKYMTREQAVLSVTEADYEKYIRRDDAVAKGEDAQLAILSNISDDEQAREDFWKAVTKCERKASPDQVTLYGDRLSRAEWETIRDMAAAPAELQDAADQMVKYHDLPADEPSRAGMAKVTLELDRVHFDAVRRLLRRSRAWDRKRPAATIKKGRGGRTQQRIVAAFPAGLEVVSMLRILRRYCEWLESRGVMYTAVIHAPDYHNDERNFHLHLAYYERPCSWLKDEKCWDFEYRVKVPNQWNRWRFSKRQNKIEDFSRAPAGSEDAPWEHRAKEIFGLRGKFSDLCNDELLSLGINRLLDPRRYEEMGITQEPCEKLGPKGSALQAAGVAIEKDIWNAERTYNRAFADALRESAKRAQRRARIRKKAEAARSWLEASGEEPQTLATLNALIESLDTLSTVVGNQEEERDLLLLTAKMACSRADKTSEYCERLLAAIDDGSATRTEERMAPLVEARLAEANTHLDNVGVTSKEFEHLGQLAEDLAREVDKLEAVVGELVSVVPDDAPFVQAHLLDEAKAVVGDPRPVTDAERQTRDRQSKSVAAYFSSPLEYEEGWDNVFDRINRGSLEIKAPDADRKLGYHVPGIAKEDLEMLLNPIFFARSQARLKGIYEIRRFKDARRDIAPSVKASPEALGGRVLKTGKPQEIVSASPVATVTEPDRDNAELKAPAPEGRMPGVAQHIEGAEAEGARKVASANEPAKAAGSAHQPAPLDRVHLDKPGEPDIIQTRGPSDQGGHSPAFGQSQESRHSSGVDYDRLAEIAVQKAEEDRRKAVSEWMEELAKVHDDNYLPVRWVDDKLVIDVTDAPKDMRAEIFAEDPLVLERAQREHESRREEVLLLIQSHSMPVITFDNGECRFDRKVFSLDFWRFLPDLVRHDTEIASEVEKKANSVAPQIDAPATAAAPTVEPCEESPVEIPGLTPEQLFEASKNTKTPGR